MYYRSQVKVAVKRKAPEDRLPGNNVTTTLSQMHSTALSQQVHKLIIVFKNL